MFPRHHETLGLAPAGLARNFHSLGTAVTSTENDAVEAVVMQRDFNRRVVDRWSDTEDRIKEEIAFLEARLAAIGDYGDCAYEKALARSYRLLLEEKRALVAGGA